MLRRFADSLVVWGPMRICVVLTGVVVLALAGCGGDEAEAPGGGDGGARLEGPLTYTRGGGIAGRADKLVVQPDGAATLTTRQGGERRFRLAGDELAGLASELRRANLDELPERSVSDPPVPDAFGHRIAYGGATVTTDDPAMPEQLSALVGRLGGLVEAHEKG
jgi:hypothetical protein